MIRLLPIAVTPLDSTHRDKRNTVDQCSGAETVNLALDRVASKDIRETVILLSPENLFYATIANFIQKKNNQVIKSYIGFK